MYQKGSKSRHFIYIFEGVMHAINVTYCTKSFLVVPLSMNKPTHSGGILFDHWRVWRVKRCVVNKDSCTPPPELNNSRCLTCCNAKIDLLDGRVLSLLELEIVALPMIW